MKKIIFLLMILMVILTSFSFAAGQKEAAGQEYVEEWEIPFLNCLTGPIASIGEYLQWGAERAAYEINEAGGIAGKPVKIIGVDTGMSPEKGTVEMAKISEKALVALGPVPEPVIMAAMPIAVKKGLFSFTATTSYEYAEKFFPWSISWFPPTEQRLGAIITAWAKKRPEMKNVVQFVENYGPWPGMAAAHVKGLKDAGITAVDDIDVPGDAVTFGPLAVKTLAKKPDSIIFVCNAEKVAKLILELRDRGWTDNSKFLIFSSADDGALYTTGGDNINGSLIYNYVDPNLDTPRWAAFRQAFKDDHEGMEPFSLSPNYYDAVYMIKRAIEDLGITGAPAKLAEERKAIADYCRNIQKFDGLFFEWTNKDGVPTDKPVFIFEIQSGKKILVETIKG